MRSRAYQAAIAISRVRWNGHWEKTLRKGEGSHPCPGEKVEERATLLFGNFKKTAYLVRKRKVEGKF